MRKALIALALMFASLICMTSPARAESLTAGNIFGMFGGTTTVDQGGALHSQARSIYSLGGGMTSFQGKRVTLLAVDPPSFSAGCSGISWHFGGFSFISADEIRQLVEAVAQASLGVAVDLAMQTLCPQCYAVMSKLRDIANTMRNAAADACSIAQNFGDLLSPTGKYTPGGSKTTCAQATASDNKSASWLDSIAVGGCKLLQDAEKEVGDLGKSVMDWANTGSTANGKTPTKTATESIGNKTYLALDAMGYKDGVAKDLVMSFLGMTIVPPPDTDCKGVMTKLSGSSVADSTGSSNDKAVLGTDDKQKGEVTSTNSATKPTTSDAATIAAKANPGDATKGQLTCYLPPKITGLEQIGSALVCGFAPLEDARRFAAKFHRRGASTEDQMLAKLASTSLGELCNVKVLEAGNVQVGQDIKDFVNPFIYTCRKGTDSDCMVPREVRVRDLVKQTVDGEYTGLAWMILDALYDGVEKIYLGKEEMNPRTIQVLNSSGYPLYRLLNMAAVYPGMSDDMLQAYGGIIAVQYVFDTLEKISRVGAQPSMHTSKPGVAPGEVARMREEINDMFTRIGPIKDKTLRRMNEKRALVDSILQANRSIQAEVISRGLGDNNNMAITLKKQRQGLKTETKK